MVEIRAPLEQAVCTGEFSNVPHLDAVVVGEMEVWLCVTMTFLEFGEVIASRQPL